MWVDWKLRWSSHCLMKNSLVNFLPEPEKGFRLFRRPSSTSFSSFRRCPALLNFRFNQIADQKAQFNGNNMTQVKYRRERTHAVEQCLGHCDVSNDGQLQPAGGSELNTATSSPLVRGTTTFSLGLPRPTIPSQP